MKNLFFGGSSQIAKSLAKKLNSVENIGRSKCNIYKKNYIVKDYNKRNIDKVLQKVKNKYDNILIFNGLFSISFLSSFDEKLFNFVFDKNFKIPMIISSSVIKKRLLNHKGSIILFSSIAANSYDSGNAYYSISKNALNFAGKILSREQKKRGVRINVLSLGIVDNKMGKAAKKISKNKIIIYRNNKYLNKIVNILKNKKINGKNIVIK